MATSDTLCSGSTLTVGIPSFEAASEGARAFDRSAAPCG